MFWKGMFLAARGSFSLAKENEGAGEVENAEEVLGLALVAGDEATESMEPSEEALHLPVSLVERRRGWRHVCELQTV